MPVKPLNIEGCWVFEPRIFNDERGYFFEWFQDSTFREQARSDFQIAQANCSVSKAGVIRGIHVAKNPPGQAKYVTCFSGSVFDVVIDLRPDSTTFGKWDSVVIKANEPKAVYIPSGIGHAFMALEDQTTFVYLCDQRYNPTNEFDINPKDPTINITWPSDLEHIFSSKDLEAPLLEDAIKNLTS